MNRRFYAFSVSCGSAAMFTLLACLLLASVALGQTQQQQQTDPAQQTDEKLKINTSLVTVPVIVTDGYGRFVTGLKEKNFSIREDGVTQRIEDFDDTESPFYVALLIDTSRSTKNKLGVIRKAAREFIKQLQPNDRVMVVTFDDSVRFVSDFSGNYKELDRAIGSAESSYYTTLYDAIYQTVTEKLLPLKGRKAIVVLTDGVDTHSKLATYESVLDLVAAQGVITYAIQYETRNDGSTLMKPMFIPGQRFMPSGSASLPQQEQRSQSEPSKEKPIINIPRTAIPGVPGRQPEPAGQSRSGGQVIYVGNTPKRDRYLIATEFLRSLALQSGARHIRAENIENTSFAFALIAEELRHQYTLTYYSSNEARDGKYRAISVNVTPLDRAALVRSRPGYHAPRGESEPESRNQQ